VVEAAQLPVMMRLGRQWLDWSAVQAAAWTGSVRQVQMATRITLEERRQAVASARGQYARAGRQDKSRLLDEVVVVTGYHRKYALQLLNGGAPPVQDVPQRRTRRRSRKYDNRVLEALVSLWYFSGQAGSRRLVRLMPLLLAASTRSGRLDIEADVNRLLASVSPTTVDRLLSPERARSAVWRRSGRKSMTARAAFLPGWQAKLELDKAQAEAPLPRSCSGRKDLFWSRDFEDRVFRGCDLATTHDVLAQGDREEPYSGVFRLPGAHEATDNSMVGDAGVHETEAGDCVQRRRAPGGVANEAPGDVSEADSGLPRQAVTSGRSWRTRPDPFAAVWEEISLLCMTNPGLSACALLRELQRRHPGGFADGQRRTLQRRLAAMRDAGGDCGAAALMSAREEVDAHPRQCLT
jgi:hypothetical protein